MSEKIKARLQVTKIEFADPIATAAAYKTATFKEQPFTLQDDSINLVQDDLEEDEIKVNELDTALDVDYYGGMSRFTGSFVEPTLEQLKALTGDETSEGFTYAHSAKAKTIKKSILITCADGSLILLPNASGYVKMDFVLNRKTGRRKYPFKFSANAASPEWAVDIAYPEKRPGE